MTISDENLTINLFSREIWRVFGWGIYRGLKNSYNLYLHWRVVTYGKKVDFGLFTILFLAFLHRETTILGVFVIVKVG